MELTFAELVQMCLLHDFIDIQLRAGIPLGLNDNKINWNAIHVLRRLIVENAERLGVGDLVFRPISN